MNKKYWILPLLLLLCGARSGLKPPVQEKLNVPELLGELENPDPAVREKAVLKTRRLAAQLELSRYETSQYRCQVSDAVKKLLNDKEKRVRYISALALKRLAYDNEVDRNLPIPVFIKALKDKEMDQPRILEEIISEFWSLEHKRGAGEVKARKEEIITALKEHLNDTDKYIRYATAIALGELDSSGNKDIIMPVFLEALAETFKEKKLSESYKLESYKSSIANVCYMLGPKAKEAVPELIQVKKEIDLRGWNSSTYSDALIKIGTPEAMDAAAGGRGSLIMARILAYHPVSDFVIAFCFGWLFWKSVKLRKKGKKVFHWFLIIPVLFYTLFGIINIPAPVVQRFDILDCRDMFIFFASIGLIPWLLSWLFIWRSEKRKKQPVS